MRPNPKRLENAMRELTGQEVAPVAWQWRYSYRPGEWGDWTNEHRFTPCIAEETRPLYAAPVQAQVAPVADAVCILDHPTKGSVTCGESIVAEYLAQEYRWDYQATAEARSISLALWRYWHDQQKTRAEQAEASNEALRVALEEAKAEIESLKICAREAIQAGESLIKTLREERDAALAALQAEASGK